MQSLTPLQIFLGFSKIGLSGFGGVLPWARRTLVERDKWLTPEEFNAMLGICQLVPGPNIVNLAVCVGARFAGVMGVFAATFGILLGPIFVVIALGLLYEHFSYLDSVQGMLRGVSAVGIGLVASTGLKMVRSEFKYPPMLLVIGLTILAATYFNIALGWVVMLASPIALLLGWKKAQKI